MNAVYENTFIIDNNTTFHGYANRIDDIVVVGEKRNGKWSGWTITSPKKLTNPELTNSIFVTADQLVSDLYLVFIAITLGAFVPNFKLVAFGSIATFIAAVALICFIFSWNEYFLATLLTTSDAKTAPPFLASFVDGRGLFLGVLSAAAMVAALPVLIAGWVAQKQLVRGLAMGAVK